jgi:predicted RNA methylase
MKYENIREEELKNKVAQDYFWIYDCTKIIGNVDFCVSIHQTEKGLFEQESLLWAEAKKGSSDIIKSIVQLILTIGKARTFDKSLPPAMLGAFDAEKIAFIAYNDIQDVFYQNDFNWNVAPSNHETKEFQTVYNKVKTGIDLKTLLFYYDRDDKELKRFIKQNFVVGKFGFNKVKIDKNNFVVIYNKWLEVVKPTILVNWEIAKKSGIIDGDFYLADLLSIENETLKEKLYVLLKKDHYELDRKMDELGLFSSRTTSFNDHQKAHNQFWNKYDRPPKEEYWDYIVERRDLLVPQDVRERKGSFFTPQIWVELSQKYLTDVLGQDWQDEYYIWDCAAGTGNLLTGLTNKYNIWASTLDTQDVEVMKDRIKNGANLLEDHVFQFDFLNDDFTKLPKPLQDIVNDPEKRKKLVVYINPPYAEVSSIGHKGKAGVNQSIIHDKYLNKIGTAGRELFILFLVRVYSELNGCVLAEFSKLKVFQGSAFESFRFFFKANLIKAFIVPANTFDNVKGKFPIGFKVWNTLNGDKLSLTVSDIYNEFGVFVGNKSFTDIAKRNFINKWISIFKVKNPKDSIGFLAGTNGNDFQQNAIVYILNKREQMANPRGIWVTAENLIFVSIFNAVRKCIAATWLNDRDQFLYPKDGWQQDTEFQNDCLAFTLFSNNIQSRFGTNHWIPFTEQEVNAREKFESNFMSRFIAGKLKHENTADLFGEMEQRTTPLIFSTEATQVFAAGKELWKYYHEQPGCNVNASLYDIREHFQGRNEKGKMNNRSNDETYTLLIARLRNALKILAGKIEPKVYEYEFLKL